MTAYIHRWKLEPKDEAAYSLPCHIYIGDVSLEVFVSGNQDGNAYTVTNEDFEICKKLESFFDELNLIYQKNLTIENNAGCVSPKKYPELFVKL